jgi:hypothetical protein
MLSGDILLIMIYDADTFFVLNQHIELSFILFTETTGKHFTQPELNIMILNQPAFCSYFYILVCNCLYILYFTIVCFNMTMMASEKIR